MKAFAGSNDVSFGDINLSEDPIRGNHNPGAGGWPTIRYFNEDTGVEGGTYVKKTDDAMCVELGNSQYMEAYIEEYGNTSLCSVADGAGCDDREKEYIDRMKAKSEEDVTAQLSRLKAMEGESMKPELAVWVKKRRKILAQLAPAAKDEL